MAKVEYSDLESCKAFVQSRTRVLDDTLITTVLSDTVGKDKDGGDVFRPYWASSVVLDLKLQQITKAEGAEFRDLQYNINALKEHQWTVDESLGLLVPAGTGRSTVQRSQKGGTKTVRRVLRLYG